jgi:hypothetical protein
LTVLITLLDTHAGVIQAVSAVVLVVFTGFLVWVTRTYADAADRQAQQATRQVEETQQQRFDQYRPVVHPAGDLATNQPLQVDWYQQGYDLQLQNVGAGVALIVCGVMFPPEGVFPVNQLSPRYTLWREAAFLSGQPARSVKLELGRTMTDGDATIGGHRLFAPRRPTDEERRLCGLYNVIARLTLTYQDIFMRKHAATIDYIDLYGWQCVALSSDVAKDLEDLDQDAHRKMHDAVNQARSADAAAPNRTVRR